MSTLAHPPRPPCLAQIRTALTVALWLLSAVILAPLSAQESEATGGVRGRVIDADFNTALPGVTVEIEGEGLRVETDADGNFSIIGLKPGRYNIRASREGFASATERDVVVNAGQLRETTLALTAETVELDEVVTVPSDEDDASQISALDLRLEVSTFVDTLGEDFLDQTGAGDVGEALTKLAGTSTVDSRYIVVRGLADRYNTVLLNGLRVPSSDPDKRAVNVDLFPSSIVSTLTLAKTFTPDLPGEFGGSSVNVITKSIPAKTFLSSKFKVGFNTQATGNKNWLSYRGGGTKIYGVATERRLPPEFRFDPSSGVNSPPEVQAAAGRLPLVMASRKETAPVDWEFSLDAGTRVQFFDRPLGVSTSFSYGRSYGFDPRNIVERSNSFSGQVLRRFDGDIGTEKLQITGLLEVGYEIDENNEVATTLFLNRVAEDRASYQEDTLSPPEVKQRDVLLYTERDLFTVQLRGKHVLPAFNEAVTKWGFAASKSSQLEPDIRKFVANALPSFNLAFLGGDPIGTALSRAWREVRDTSYNGYAEHKLPLFDDGTKKAAVVVGMNFETTNRNYREDLYRYEPTSFGVPTPPGRRWAEGFFEPFSGGGLVGKFVEPTIYNAKQNILAGYLTAQFDLTENINVLFGGRVEQTDIVVRGPKQVTYIPGYNDNLFFDPETGAILGRPITSTQINEVDLLPAISIGWDFFKDMKLRAAWSKTLARPSLKEIAPIAILDPLTDDLFQGNLALKLSSIDNFDVRVEWSPNPGDLIAGSVFGKEIYRPIELLAGRDTVRFGNSNRASVYGAELEVQKSLAFIEPLKHVNVGANVAVIKSQVGLNATRIAQLQQRGIRTTNRRLQAQPDYTFNFNVVYDNKDVGLSYGIFYNIVGPLLYAAGGDTDTADVFQKPYAGLDAFVKKTFFDDRISLTLRASNILNSKIERFYDVPQRFLYSESTSGVSYSISLSGEW